MIPLVFMLLLLGFKTLYGQVFQPRHIVVVEGHKVIIPCYQNATSKDTMFWYIQPENGAIQFLASGYDGTKEAGTFNMILKPDERFTSIEKSKIEPRDAATYYCASVTVYIGATYTRSLNFGAGTKLTVESGKKEPNPPSVFVLRPQKGLSPAACLVKNFYPKDVKIYMNSKKGDVTPVLSQNGKYTAVYVEKSEEREVECKAKHEEKWVTESDVREILEDSNTSYEDKIDSRKNECKRPAGDSPGTTYENVNMLSMKILAVRFIFAKTLVFNLFLTAKCLLF
ncbi:Ig heavy chain Mem5 [Xenopus tropicalis]|uniref:Ig heavy chain Mem5 n=1 Tax=Xenopus tropicalis TaxID=8364 RepID=A0A8J1JV50_XENTR|nr:Ig heavy chain Mem5 [Xenopus tropicalis]